MYNREVKIKDSTTPARRPRPRQNAMIEARKNFLGELLVFWMARRSLWKAFHAVRFRAAEPLPAPPSGLTTPVIFYANHNTWWDGYLAQIITKQVYGLDGYLMMDVRQLRRYWFFSWAGVFSVDQQNGREALRSLDYTARLLKAGPGRALWIFPQGQIEPQERRPLGFHSGLGHLIRRVGRCYVYPVAVRFEFFGEQYPEILLDVGPARLFEADQVFDPKKLTAELETTLTERLNRLREDATALKLDDFVTIIKGRGSTDTFFDTLSRPFRKKSDPRKTKD